MSTVKIKEIEVVVTYKVGLGGVDLPEHLRKDLEHIFEEGLSMDPGGRTGMEYPELSDFLADLAKERDCFDWKCEVDHLEFK